jgi:hypothetical protein
MKKLVCSRADENIKDMTDISFPIIKDYAKKWGADFEVLSHLVEDAEGPGKYHYRIFKVADFLKTYDQVLHIDADVIINKGTPNPFPLYSEPEVCSVFEDFGTRKKDRIQRVKKAEDRWGSVGFSRGYINTGFFLANKGSEDIFQKVNGEYWSDFGYDDVHLRYNILKYKKNLQQLGEWWNHMTMFSEPWNFSKDRFASFILHYAGNGIFDEGVSSRVEQMRKDAEAIYG